MLTKTVTSPLSSWLLLCLGRPMGCGKAYVKHFAKFPDFFETQCWRPCMRAAVQVQLIKKFNGNCSGILYPEFEPASWMIFSTTSGLSREFNEWDTEQPRFDWPKMRSSKYHNWVPIRDIARSVSYCTTNRWQISKPILNGLYLARLNRVVM